MRALRDTISRIRWGMVFGILFLITLTVLVLNVFNPFSPPYTCSGDVCMRAWLEPSNVGLSGESTIWVEIKSSGKMTKPMHVSLRTSSRNLWFSENSNRTLTKDIALGPGESRKLDFDLRVDTEYGGEYVIDIELRFGTKKIDDRVYLRVIKKK